MTPIQMGRIDFHFCCAQSMGKIHLKNSTAACLSSINVPVILNNSLTSLELLSTKEIVHMKAAEGSSRATKTLILERRAAVGLF